MFNIIIGLICVMLANIFLGTSIATLKKQFKKEKFLKGFVKLILIVTSIIMMYLCSYLNPDILVANINGQDVNLINGMELIFIAGIVMYGYKDLVKLKDLLQIKVDVNEADKNE